MQLSPSDVPFFRNHELFYSQNSSNVVRCKKISFTFFVILKIKQICPIRVRAPSIYKMAPVGRESALWSTNLGRSYPRLPKRWGDVVACSCHSSCESVYDNNYDLFFSLITPSSELTQNNSNF